MILGWWPLKTLFFIGSSQLGAELGPAPFPIELLWGKLQRSSPLELLARFKEI